MARLNACLCLRTIRCPGELCRLRLNDVKFKGNICWIRIGSSKTDQFSNGKFIPVKCIDSPYCLVRLLKRYMSVRPNLLGNSHLFLSKQGKQLTVGAIGVVVKRLAKHSRLESCYTAHSIRIGGATAAMEAGLSLTQIRAIGGWDNKAVMLYLRLVGTAHMQ
ncbi:23896_t:CDS:2, partial [Cetraspora pellucida]